MPKAKYTRSSLSRKEATLYLLRSEDSVTRKPMSVKLGFSTRPIQQRQDELSASREKFTTRLALHTVTNAPVYEKLAKLLLREIMPERWISFARQRRRARDWLGPCSAWRHPSSGWDRRQRL